LHQRAIDTTTPARRMFFQVTGAFAEFVRGMICISAWKKDPSADGVHAGFRDARRPRTG
jgi:hypothetical protein